MTLTQTAPQTQDGDRAGERVWRTELSPVSFLRRAAEVHADAPALVHGVRRLSYRELNERVSRLTSALCGLGVYRGDRVAVLAPNSPAMVEAHFAVPAAGALLVCINIRQSPDEVTRLLEHAEPGVILVNVEYEGLLSSFDTSSVEVIRIADSGAPDDPYERFVASGALGPPLVGPGDEEDAIAINYTSGRTGDPKGVICTHRGAYLNALSNVIEAGLTSRSRLLLVVPLFHCNGWCFPWGAVAVGATIICLRRVDPAQIWRLIDEEGVTHFNSAPTVQIALVNDPAAPAIAVEEGNDEQQPGLGRQAGLDHVGERVQVGPPVRVDHALRSPVCRGVVDRDDALVTGGRRRALTRQLRGWGMQAKPEATWERDDGGGGVLRRLVLLAVMRVRRGTKVAATVREPDDLADLRSLARLARAG